VKVPLKAMQVLGQEAGESQSTSRRHSPVVWSTPNSESCTSNHTAIVRSKTSPLLSTTEHDTQSPSFSTDSSSPVLSDIAQSPSPQADVGQQGASRLEATAPEVQDLHYIRKYNDRGNEILEQPGEDKRLRVKAKRSLRNIFHRRTPKKKPLPSEKRDSKRSSIAGSILAQRMKKSANISKVSIARQFETKPAIKDDFVSAAKSTDVSGKEVDRRAALSALESVPPELLPSVNSDPQHDATKVIHNILDRVISMGEDSGDRLRGLEVAEVWLLIW
jgi:hypothetical protein